MSEITEEQLQEMIADINAGGVISASLEWSFDADGKVASEIYGIFSYGWSDKKTRVEITSTDHDVLGAAIESIYGLSNLKEMI